MKYYLSFKTPDVLDQVQIDDDDEQNKFKQLCNKYFEYNEYVTICVDTDEMTVKVKP